MFKKRRFVMFILLMISLFVLSGCSNQTKIEKGLGEFNEPIYDWGDITGETLTVWGDKDDLSRTYTTVAFERYQKLTGNTLELVPLSKTDLDVKLPKAFASDTEERPDILFIYGGANVGNLNPDQNFYDFTDAPWVDDLNNTSLNQSIYNGKVIGLPYGEASVSGTLYNKEIFEKYGLEIPTNQKEFLDVCEVLLQNGVTPMYLPYAEITMLLYQFPMDSILQNQSILDGLNDGTMTYGQIPEMKKIVEWYKIMADRGYFGKDYTRNDWNGMDNALKSDKYAMMLCWDTWIYTNYTGNPKKLGIMPAFMGNPENGCFEGANTILALANKKSPNLEASLDFITFLADPYNYNVAFEGIYTAPVYNNQTGSITTPQYMESERLIEKLFCDSTAWSRVKGFSQIDAVYIQNYMQGKCSMDECLKDMDESRIKRSNFNSQTIAN